MTKVIIETVTCEACGTKHVKRGADVDTVVFKAGDNGRIYISPFATEAEFKNWLDTASVWGNPSVFTKDVYGASFCVSVKDIDGFWLPT